MSRYALTESRLPLRRRPRLFSGFSGSPALRGGSCSLFLASLAPHAGVGDAQIVRQHSHGTVVVDAPLGIGTAPHAEHGTLEVSLLCYNVQVSEAAHVLPEVARRRPAVRHLLQKVWVHHAAYSERLRDPPVVRSPRDLDVAPALKAHPVPGMDVSEIHPPFISRARGDLLGVAELAGLLGHVAEPSRRPALVRDVETPHSGAARGELRNLVVPRAVRHGARERRGCKFS